MPARSPAPTGIKICGTTSFSGGIINAASGTISGNIGINVDAVSNFSGGITNAGTMTAGQHRH